MNLIIDSNIMINNRILYINLKHCILVLSTCYRLPSQIEITMMQMKYKSSEIIIQSSNTSDEAVYVLKYHTPLEGLKSPFLAIKNNEGTEIKYNGYCFKRCPPTKKRFHSSRR